MQNVRESLQVSALPEGSQPSPFLRLCSGTSFPRHGEGQPGGGPGTRSLSPPISHRQQGEDRFTLGPERHSAARPLWSSHVSP